MADDSLEHALRNLPDVGQLVKDRGYRQIWRFVVGDKAYYLKFYPRAGFFWKRLIRGNPAMREFSRLQTLQKAKVPSPRVRSVLVGFRLKGEIGDAVIIDAIEPSIQLDHYLNEFELKGEPIPHHRELVQSLIDVLARLASARLGHADLHLGNFLLHDHKVFLLDGYAVHPGGLKTDDVSLLAYSVRRHATRTDLLRGWYALSQGADPPRRNTTAARQISKFLSRVDGENRYFGRFAAGEWSGHFFKHSKFAQRWSRLSTKSFAADEVKHIWDHLLDRIQRDDLKVLKRTHSGDVLEGVIDVDGETIEVIVKRPKRKYWRRIFLDLFRRTRAQRVWRKAWNLFIRGFAMEWPLMLMERRVMGYAVESVVVFEKMQGTLLSILDLDSLSSSNRDKLFRRLGRTLRNIDRESMAHFDAKMSNWIIRMDENLGPLPILIDVDGVRGYSQTGAGMDRLLRSMREHLQYTPEDSLALCQGYAPFARFARDMLSAPTDVEAPGDQP